MPVVRKVIGDFLPTSVVLNNVPEDEIIALGAAKQVKKSCFFQYFVLLSFISLDI